MSAAMKTTPPHVPNADAGADTDTGTDTGADAASATPGTAIPVPEPTAPSVMAPLMVEAGDFYLENGRMVFTATFHLRRGYCCCSRCRHCPYRDWRRSP